MDAAAHALILRLMRHWTLAASWAVGALAFGQTATLQSGTLHVLPGTTVRFNGVSDLVIAAGAQVINDGLIDLGADCLLQEQPGAPITGSGVEQAVWPIAVALDASHPGHLGLALTSAYAAGDLEVIRGHIPRSTPTGVQSVARWFQVIMPSGATDADVALRYDLSELNGIDPLSLALHASPAETGPWTELTSLNAPGLQQVSAAVPAAWAFVTAFDGTATMLEQPADPITWAMWPNITEGVVFISIPESEHLSLIEVLDPAGRLVRSLPYAVIGPAQARVELNDLPPGPYLLRPNKGWAQRVIKR